MYGNGFPIVKFSLAILLSAGSLAHSQVSPIPATWNRGTGNWEDPAQWLGIPGIYPNDDGTNYYATTVPTGSATINSSIAVNSLNITGGAVDIAQSALLTVENMSISNGQTTTNIGGILTVANGSLQADGNLTIQGGFNLNGSLTGAGSISVTSIGFANFTGFQWTSGQISGAGHLTVSGLAGATIDTTSAPVSFGGWTIAGAELFGMTWTGTHDVISTGGGTIALNGPFNLLADQTFGVLAAPGVAPITISIGGFGSLVKNSPGATHLENVVISSENLGSRIGLLPSEVNVSQGTLILDNPLSIGNVNVDGVLQAPSISVSQISGHGTIQAAVSTQSVVFTNSPQIQIQIPIPSIANNLVLPPPPLPQVGSLHINGDCTLTSNLVSVVNGASLAETVLDFNILGPAAGQRDELDITGALSFAPASAPLVFFIGLNFTNYLPQAGDTFDLITYGSLQNFTTPLVDCVGLAPGFEFSITPTGNALVFTALNDAQPIPEPAFLAVLPIVLFLKRLSRPNGANLKNCSRLPFG